jgi:sugar (pentulose or hexulose) kinase
VIRGAAAILDVGKTNAKLTLWDGEGRVLARRSRANAQGQAPGYRALDVTGIEAWMVEVLREYATLADVRAILPVAHGAAAALLHERALFAQPMDYEDEGGTAERAAYAADRDPFAATGSPALPQGLNLGFQLHRLEAITGPWPDALQIVTWPQYWAWRLSGVAASEVSSLGCHSDLWNPAEGGPSGLSIARGWARRLGPLRHAAEVLGPITPEWAELTGLPAACAVHCGLHDSNAALLAARGHAEMAGGDATVLSTGTWFVAMRSPAAAAEAPGLSEERDGLLNVDVEGRPVPSARFMGGREAELIAGVDHVRLTGNEPPDDTAGRLSRVVADGVSVLPSFAVGTGPFPRRDGRWVNAPAAGADRAAATALYLALMADEMLDLIGSCDRLLVEGRFAESEAFVGALAALRPEQRISVSSSQDQGSYGALRLIHPELPPPSPLRRVQPLDVRLDGHRAAWRAAIGAQPRD